LFYFVQGQRRNLQIWRLLYTESRGDMDAIMDSMLCANNDDEAKIFVKFFRVLSPMAAWRPTKPSLMNPRLRKRASKRKVKDFMLYTKYFIMFGENSALTWIDQSQAPPTMQKQYTKFCIS